MQPSACVGTGPGVGTGKGGFLGFKHQKGPDRWVVASRNYSPVHPHPTPHIPGRRLHVAFWLLQADKQMPENLSSAPLAGTPTLSNLFYLDFKKNLQLACCSLKRKLHCPKERMTAYGKRSRLQKASNRNDPRE